MLQETINKTNETTRRTNIFSKIPSRHILNRFLYLEHRLPHHLMENPSSPSRTPPSPLHRTNSLFPLESTSHSLRKQSTYSIIRFDKLNVLPLHKLTYSYLQPIYRRHNLNTRNALLSLSKPK